MKASYLLVGKTIRGESNPDNGYVDLTEMSNIVKQAFQTESLKEWSNTGGEMLWYFNVEVQNVEQNKQVLNYFKTISEF